MTFVARSLSPETPINISESSMLSETGMVTWDQVNAMFQSQNLQPASAARILTPISVGQFEDVVV